MKKIKYTYKFKKMLCIKLEFKKWNYSYKLKHKQSTQHILTSIIYDPITRQSSLQ